MPRFFIHTDDDDMSHKDRDGYVLPDMNAARAAAIDALPDMARDKLPDGDHRTFTVVVEDETGTVIYDATLELIGHWRTTPPRRTASPSR